MSDTAIQIPCPHCGGAVKGEDEEKVKAVYKEHVTDCADLNTGIMPEPPEPRNGHEEYIRDKFRRKYSDTPGREVNGKWRWFFSGFIGFIIGVGISWFIAILLFSEHIPTQAGG